MQFEDRGATKSNSRLSEFLSIFSFLHELDLQRQLHSSKTAVFFILWISSIWQLAVLPGNPEVEHSPQSKWRSSFYRVIQTNFDLQQVDDAYIIVGFTLCTVLAVFVLGLTAYIAFLQRSGQGQLYSRVILTKWFCFILSLNLTILLIPTVAVCFTAITKFKTPAIAFSAVTLLTIPFQLVVHSIFTFDYTYIRLNLLQGLEYRWFSIRTTGLFVTSMIYYGTHSHNFYSINLLVNLLALLFVATEAIYRIRRDVFLSSSWINLQLNIGDAICISEASIKLCEFLIPDLSSKIDLDYVCLITSLGIYFILGNCIGLFRSRIIWKILKEDRMDPQSRLIGIRMLYDSFLNQTNLEKKMFLYSFMANHMETCSEPMCLCFYSKLFLDSEKGIDSGKYARQLFHKIKGLTDQSNKSSLVIFNDLRFIKKMQAARSQVVSILNSKETNFVKVEPMSTGSHHRVEPLLNLEDDAGFKIFLSSYFCRLDLMSTLKSNFTTVFSLIRFLSFEYGSPLAGLVLSYDYINSSNYAREKSAYFDLLLKNLINKNKKLLLDEENKTLAPTKNQFDTLNISSILRFRQRAQSVKQDIQSLIHDKIDFYRLMYNQTIDFKQMIECGCEIYKQIQQVTKELDDLTSTGGSNSVLIRDALFFELCVLERNYLTPKLRKKYKEVFSLVKKTMGSISSTNSRYRFNLYSSSNVVICLKRNQNEFRIDYSTENAGSMLGTGQAEIKGINISQFMPAQIGRIHDEVILDFLNGNSKCKQSGKIYSTVITRKGTVKSVMTIPKIEWLLLDSVMVGALISYRNKNRIPLVCTDQLGNMFGANTNAQKMLSRNLSIKGSSVLLHIPGILPLYFPEFNSEKYLKMSSTVSKAANVYNQEPEKVSVDRSEYFSQRSYMELFIFQLGQINTRSVSVAEEYSCKFSQQQTTEDSDSSQNLHQKSAGLVHSEIVQFILSLNLAFKKVFSKEEPVVHRGKLCFERMDYQQNISIIDISIEGMQSTDDKVRKFFKNFSKNAQHHFLQTLMVPPQALNLAFKLSACQQHLAVFTSLFKRSDTPTNSRLYMRFSSELKYLKDLQKMEAEDRYLKKPNTDPVLLQNLQIPWQESMASIEIPQQFDRLQTPKGDHSIEPENALGKDEEDFTKSDILGQEEAQTPAQVKLFDALRKIDGYKSELLTLVNQEMIDVLLSGINLTTYSKKLFDLKTTQNSMRKLGSRIELDRELAAEELANLKKEQEFILEGENMSGGSREKSVSSPKIYIGGIGGGVGVGIGGSQENKKIAAGVHDQPSTLLNSSIKSSSSGGEASLMRIRIQNSSKTLSFHKIEYLLYVLFLASLAMKLIFRQFYQTSINNIFNYEVFANKYANLLRPSSFIYREATKGQVLQYLQTSVEAFPNKTLFSESQLSYYDTRLGKQVNEIITYVDKRIKTNYSMDANIREVDMSLFSLGYTLLLEYRVLMKDLLHKDGTYDSEGLKTSIALSTSIYDVLIRVFLNQEQNKNNYLQSMFLFFYLDFSCNIQLTVCLIILIVIIYRSMYHQTKYVSELLLKIEKNKFNNAINLLSKNLSEIEQKKFKEKNLIEEAALVKKPDEINILKAKTTKQAKSKNFSKDSILYKQFHNTMGSYSTFAGYPSRNLSALALKVVAVYMILNITTIYNFIAQQSFFTTLETSLQSSADMNLCSSSFFYVQAALNRHYLELSTGKNSTGNYLLATAAFNQSAANINRFKEQDERYLYSLMITTQICDFVKTILPEEIKTNDCLLITNGDKNFTFYKGLMRFSDIFTDVSRVLEADPSSAKTYFESERFFKFEYLAFYMTISLRNTANDYMQRILAFIQDNLASSNSLTYWYFGLITLSVVAFKLWWLPIYVRKWQQVQEVLLILNNEIISNTYLKSYFVNKK